MVEEHDVILLALRHFQTVCPAIRCVDLHFCLLQKPPEHFQIQIRIIDNENPHFRRREFFPIFPCPGMGTTVCFGKISHRLCPHNLLAKQKGKLRTFAIGTFHHQFAVHKRQQTMRNAHAQARSFNITIAFFLNALKGCKELGNILLPDADACVPDADMQIDPIPLRLFHRDSQRDAPRFRIFHGIGQKIREDLLDPYLIAMQEIRYSRIGIHAKRESFVRCPFLYHAHQVVQQGTHFIVHGNDFHLPCFNLREIQNVIDQPKQILSGISYVARIFHERFVVKLAQDHLIHAKDGIDGSADVM